MDTDLVSVAELRPVLGESQIRVVDCRFDLFDAGKGRADYLAGHIPGAVYADMDKDLASAIRPDTGRHPLPDAESFRATLESWGIRDDSFVVVYDYGNGSLAVRLWWMLRFWFGHENVAVLDGGLSAWIAAGLDVETEEARPQAGCFQRQSDDSVVATTAEIASAVLGGEAISLVDARDAARFSGQTEPIDTVAGHVPGAVNMPLADNLGADGHWRPREELADRWGRLGVNPAEGDVITMCGSGVTACHLILSAVLAGLPAPRLYVGSWSEWIRDPDRPIGGSGRG